MLKSLSKSWKLTIITLILVVAAPVLNDVLAPYGIIITEAELNHYLMIFFGVSGAGIGASAFKRHTAAKKNNKPPFENKEGDLRYDSDSKKFHEFRPAEGTVDEWNNITNPPSPQRKDGDPKYASQESPLHESVSVPVADGMTTGKPRTTSDNVTVDTSIFPPSMIDTPPTPTPPYYSAKSESEDEPILSQQDGPPIGGDYLTNFRKDKTLGNVLDVGTDMHVQRPGARSYTTMILRDADQNILNIAQSVPEYPDKTFIKMVDKDGKPFPPGKYFLQVRADLGFGDARGIRSDEFYIV